MANEPLLYSGTGAALRLAAVMMLKEAQSLLSDLTDIRQSLLFVGDVAGAGSLVNKVPQINWGDSMAAVTEGAAILNTVWNTSSVSITIAAQAIRRQISDHMVMTGGVPDWGAIGRSMGIALINRLTAMVAALFSAVSAVVNHTGAAMILDDFVTAQNTLLQAHIDAAPTFCVLATKQLSDLKDDLIGLGAGIVAFQRMDAGAMVGVSRGPGYQGNLLGTEVYTSDRVPTVGADRVGCMYQQGAFGLSVGAPPNLPFNSNPIVSIPDMALYIEFDRAAASLLSGIQGNVFMGVGQLEAARAVKILSLA